MRNFTPINAHVVKREPNGNSCHSASQARTMSKVNMVFSVLQKLKSETRPDVWEKRVAKVLPILDKLEPVCAEIANSPKLGREIKDAASHWIQLIANIRERATRTNKIIIGVFGNTGDGKSSTINALLGESRQVSVRVEEFELKLTVESLLPTNCMRACTACVTEISYNDDGDMANPYRAEIDFVSPDVWLHDIEEFLREVEARKDGDFDWDDDEPDSDAAKAVAKAKAVYANMDDEALLRSSAADLVRHPNVHGVLGTTQVFRAKTADELQALVEPYVDSSDKDSEHSVAFWPMVKAVRIFTKAKALSNGVTIVDLPGLQDSDAARSAVAGDYMKSCAGIWIVAPIHRAVDNKTAKDLMSDSFKRQLNLDESFSSVTFICSKTDQLQTQDAVKNFGKKLSPETMEAWHRYKRCTQRIKALDAERNVDWRTRTKARKNKEEADDLDESKQEDLDEEPPKKKTKSNEDQQKSRELEKLRREKDDLLREVQADCIQLRNDLSRDTLKTFFSRVVKEARQQTVAKKNGENAESKTNQSNCLDEEEISDNLPVFCISSHAFQVLEGLADEDSNSAMGFFDALDTEVPQLQKHAQDLTEEIRIAKNRDVLTGICRLLNSVALWIQNATDFAASMDAETLNSLLTELEEGMLEQTAKCLKDLEETMEIELYNKMETLATAAVKEAASIADGWCDPPSKGGMYYSTLKATFVRNGTWKDRNFNEELLEAFSSEIVDHWVQIFRMEVPLHLDDFLGETRPRLHAFHENILRHIGEDENDELHVTAQLRHQVKLHDQTMRRLIAESKASINQAQKMANREPLRIVLSHMIPGYDQCKVEKGPGSQKRMKESITEHIEDCKVRMFSNAVNGSKSILKNSVDVFSEKLREEVKNIIQTMRTDYTMALIKREQSARREEAIFKASMKTVLETTEPLVK